VRGAAVPGAVVPGAVVPGAVVLGAVEYQTLIVVASVKAVPPCDDVSVLPESVSNGSFEDDENVWMLLIHPMIALRLPCTAIV